MVSDYFKAFGASDLQALDAMYADDVTLEDQFVGLVRGKDKVLAINKEFFDANKFRLDVLGMYAATEGDGHAVEFVIFIDGQKKVQGVDLVKVKNNKIAEVRAYVRLFE